MIVGLTGRAGVGKTTIAKLLQDREGFVIRSYAYPLKKSLCALTGLSMDHFTSIELKEKTLDFGKSPRELMQLMGTEFVRQMVHRDFWRWRMAETLKSMDSTVNVVIDDIRFENEADLVRSFGGIVVHLEREYTVPTKHTGHASEEKLFQYGSDAVITSGTLNELATYHMVKRAIK